MFLFGHTGLAVGTAHWINKKFKKKIDLRYVALMSMSADLIDKPLGLSSPEFFRFNTRLIGHNLFAIVFAVSLLLAFSRRRSAIMLYALFYCSHLLLDQMWIKSPDIFYFPFGGPVQWHEPDLVRRWTDVLKTPYTLGGEVLGFSILCYLLGKYQLYRAKNYSNFIKTGTL